MNKTKANINIKKIQGTDGLSETAKELRKNGYVSLSPSLPGALGGIGDKGDSVIDLHEYIGMKLSATANNCDPGTKERKTLPFIYVSSGSEMPCEEAGTKGLGYIQWGSGNSIPNIISLLTSLIPFTAAGWKFNSDLAAGMGPMAMYHYIYISNGVVMEKDVPFEDAGLLLKSHLIELLEEKASIVGNNNDQQNEGLNSLLPIKSNNDKNKDKSPIQEIIDELDNQINQVRTDINTWEKTNNDLKDFLERNNLNQTMLQLFGDQIMLGMCFPEIQLQSTYIDTNGKPVSGANWKPKAIGIGYRMAHISRLERMDDDGKINFVYLSNQWLETPYVDSAKESNTTISSIPALDMNNPVGDLRQRMIQSRNLKLGKNARPTRFILPCSYPTPGRPYYPVKEWHSIFGGDIYEYAATLIHDRLQRKKNSNVIGRIIYIHQTYLDSLYIQMQAETPEAKAKLRDQVYDDINTFLKARDNAGQSLLGFKFMDQNSQEHCSFEIVEVESKAKDKAEANQTELQEISSIIFFAMGLDAKLIGNVPGDTTSGGGTDLRERYLLKQIQMRPTQELVLKPLDVIAKYNEWDSHLKWTIKREVMTTLDNSKTGVTSAKDNTEVAS